MVGTDPSRRVVLRPRRARMIVYPCAAALFLVLTGVAFLLPGEGEHGWGIGSRLAVVGFALGCVWFLHRLASVRVETDVLGATVVNILTRRRLEWSEIVGVRLSRDDAWMMLDVSDGSSLAAMGVQRSEGKRATVQASEFARMVADGSAVEHDD